MSGEFQKERNLLRAALGPGRDCPPLEQLERILHGPALPALKQHVNECAYCRTEVDLLRMFEAGEPADGQAAAARAVAERLRARGMEVFPQSTRRPWWQALLGGGWVRPAFAAAALLLVAAAGIEVRHLARPSLNPGDADASVYRSHSLSVIAPAGDLKQFPGEFQWQPAAGAARYELRLMEVDGAELWRVSTGDTHIAAPADIQARIVPVKTVQWQVTALDSAGRKIAESDTVRFRLLQNIYVR